MASITLKIKGVALLCLLGLGVSFTAIAEEPDYSGGMLDRAAALAAAKDVTPAKYPDAKEAVVAEMERVRYAADGTYVQWHEQYLKVLTEEGRRAHRVVTSSFTIPYQRGPEDCRIPLLEIIKPDGRTETIDVAAQGRIAINASSMAQNIYNPNDKHIQVNVAGLEAGDVLHAIFYDRIVQTRMKNTWGDWMVFEQPAPILRKIVEVTAPRALPLARTLVKSGIPGTLTSSVTNQGDTLLYRWEATNVPQMMPEPDMPDIPTVVQRVLVSTAPDWQTVSRWYWALSEPHFGLSPAIKAKVAELTQGRTARMDRIEALFRFVSQQIRYMGITTEAEAPGYEPHDVRDTFEARAGVCRDKAALLVTMLREAGFEAYPVLIHTGPKKDPEVPLPYFNHAIVAVREADGSDLLMDPTDETTSQLLPGYLRGKSYLAATPAGDTLKTSPIEPAARNLMRIATRAKLNGEGRLEAETEFRFEGVNDVAYRGFFAPSKAEDHRRFFDALIESAAPGARIERLRFAPADLTDVSTTLTVRVSYVADSPLIAGASQTMLALPLLGARIGTVNFVVGKAGLKVRKYPLMTEIACGVAETCSLDLGNATGRVVALPTARAVKSEAIEWDFGVRQTGATLEAHSDYRLKVIEFSPAQYGELKSTLQRIERLAREMVILDETMAAGDAGADAVTLHERVEYVLKDAFNWTETRSVSKRILTYGGKKANGEVKIGFNAGWESVRLLRATTTSREGRQQNVGEREVNLMDADWAGGAARYPSGKMLVISLPGVEVGGMIDYAYERVCTNQPFFAAWESFRGSDPIRSKTVMVDAPEGLVTTDTGLFEAGQVTAVTNGADGRVNTEWSLRDQAAVRKEALQPPWFTWNPTVFLSAGHWPRYARDVAARLERNAKDGREAARQAKALTRACRSEAEKLQVLRDSVALKVRLTEPGLAAAPLDALGGADRTLAEGYGNSADRATLLYAMLHATGFRPQFVLASDVPAMDMLQSRIGASPAGALFPAVLVRVPAKDPVSGKPAWIYLNDTDQYAALGATPHADRVGLVIPAGDLISIAPLRPDRAETSVAVVVATNGSARITRRERVHGNAFGAERKRFKEMTPEELRRYEQSVAASVAQSATMVGRLETDFTTYPGRIEFTVDVPDYAVQSDPFLYLLYPGWPGGLFGARTDSRVSPLYYGNTIDATAALSVRLPVDFSPLMAPAAWQKQDIGGTRSRVRVQGAFDPATNEWRTDIALHLDPCLTGPERYAELLAFDEELAHKKNRTLLFVNPAK
jgi:transglutaminase-like putative cysteine protease